MDELCGDDFWNVNLTWYTDSPDFTPCFKETVLVWVPCAFLWILSPVQIYNLKNSEYRNISWNYFNVIKLTLITIKTILLLLNITHDVLFLNLKTNIYFYSTILAILTSILFLILTYSSIKMGIRSSGIFLMYMFLSNLCELPIFLTALSKLDLYQIQDGVNTKYMSQILIYLCNTAIFVLNCFADEQPRHSSCFTEEDNSQAKNISVLSEIFLFWIDPYIWENHKNPTNKIKLNYNPKDDGTENLLKFDQGKNSTEKISILNILNAKFRFLFWCCSLFLILDVVLELGLYVVFYFLVSEVVSRQAVWKYYMFMMILFAISVTQLFIASYYRKWCYTLEIRMKNALMITLYEKALRISNGARTKYTTSDIISIMSLDINLLQSAPKHIQSLVAMMVQIIISYLFLWFILGWSILISFVVFLSFMAMSYYASAYLKILQKEEIQHKDTRNRFMQEIFAGIKVLKMYAWEYSFKGSALKLRKDELRSLKRIHLIYSIFHLGVILTPYPLYIVSFLGLVFTHSEKVTEVVPIYTMMAIYYAFRNIVGAVPHQCLSLQQTLIAVKRINNFLSAEELDLMAISHDSTVRPMVLLKKATFSWISNRGPAILHSLDLAINESELVAVVGSVGVGKSSLISACLGEMYKMSGYANTKGSVAYVPQQAWILNTTFKENVTLNHKMSNDLYEKAINACALNTDINTFPGGDLTEIGEKGINLSGGQKQRVSLARAVCQNADVYYFDDPLSALDTHVADHIFHQTIGPNSILKQKTRILVTHSANYLPFVDKIIVIKDGCITEMGTYEELLSKNGEFERLMKAEKIKKREDDLLPLADRATGVIRDTYPLGIPSKKEENKIRHKDTNERELIHKLIDEERIQTDKVYKTYLSLIVKTGIISTTVVIILFSINQVMMILSNMVMLIWLQGEDPSDNKFRFLYTFVGFCIVVGILTYIGNLNTFREILKTSDVLYVELLDRVLHWSMYLFDTIPVGRVINRFNDDVYALDNIISFNICQTLSALLRYGSLIVVVTIIIPVTILALIPFFILFYAIQILFESIFYQMKRVEAVHRSSLYSHLVETFTGFQSIRAYHFENKFITLTKEKNSLCSNAYYSSALCANWLFNRCDIAGALLFLILLIITIGKKDELFVGYMAYVISFSIQVLRGIGPTIIQLCTLGENVLSMERIQQYIEQPPEASWEISTVEVDEKWPYNGNIVFKDYTLRYRSGLENVLKGINFCIRSGEKIGIIGRTGAGKSSIFMGLLRMVEPASGTIFIDDVDITKLGLHVLRSKLTVIPQDPVLFSGTLRFNIDPFEKHSDEDLWSVLEKSHLKEYVKCLTEGLNFKIEEGGRNMSFGQRQLICLARALLRKTKILILDEATASVDMKTDELIQETIHTQFSDCTVITIAHRLNTLQNYDKILIMENGNIVRYDTVPNLLKSNY